MPPARPAPLILLVNDDGFFAEGIQALARALRGLGRTFIVAPDREKSATSMSLTLHRPLRVQKIRARVFAVDGTPADCVYLAVRKLLPRTPDLLLSGINRGPNLGQQDIAYSGTVAAALQGTFLGIPSAAISLLPGPDGGYDFGAAAGPARVLAAFLLASGPPREGLTLNINIPPPPILGIRPAELGWKKYNPEIVEKKDPRSNSYFWIGTGSPEASGGPESDIAAVAGGWITVTPLHRNLTDFPALRAGAWPRDITALDIGTGAAGEGKRRAERAKRPGRTR